MIKKRTPQIHGHRGARGMRPENSLVAVEYAIESGADSIEVDLCVTQDDILIVNHDLTLGSTLVRTGPTTWLKDEVAVRSLRVDELGQFDVGKINPDSHYANRFQTQQSIDGTPIPTLVELLDLLCQPKNQHIIINLELKGKPGRMDLVPDTEDYIALFLDVVNSYPITERLFIQSFDWRLPLQIKAINSNLKVGLLTDCQHDGNPRSPIAGTPTPWTDNLDLAQFDHSIPKMVVSAGGDVWSSNHLDLTECQVKEAHSLGVEVYVWTVNEREDMIKMIDWEVDAITTDYPKDLFNLMNEKA